MPTILISESSTSISQSPAFGYDIAISIDGIRRWVGNMFVERLWHSVKYEEVYLHAYDVIRTARTSLGHDLEFYNTERASVVGDQTPNRVDYHSMSLFSLLLKTQKQIKT